MEQRRVGLEPRDDAAAGLIQLGPPAVVVIAEIEDVGGPRLYRHLLGGRDVVDVGGADRVIDRMTEVRIIDHMRLGAAHLGRKPRPLRADAGKVQAGRVDQQDHVVHLAPNRARRHAQHVLEQSGKHQGAAAPVGVRKGRAPRNSPADVIEPRLVARHRRFDLAQRAGAGQLAVQQRDQLVTGLELAHQFIAAVLVHKPIERAPRNEFEQIVENAILMPHGVDPLSCPDDSKPSGSEKNQCRALLQAQNVPDSRGLVPAIHVFCLRGTDVDARA